GMTQQGGANVSGVIFGIDTDGTGYKDMIDLSCPIGSAPDGSLIVSGSTLYGMTSQGGGFVNYGCVFSIDTSGAGYYIMNPFNIGVNGSNPYGSLTLSGNVLYGMTYNGGVSWDGVIFGFKDTSIHVVTGINKVIITNTNITNLYPNPNMGIFTIELANSYQSTNGQIEIYDMFGAKIYTTKINSSNAQIDIGNKANGVYLYRVLTETGNLISTGKFVIQK